MISKSSPVNSLNGNNVTINTLEALVILAIPHAAASCAFQMRPTAVRDRTGVHLCGRTWRGALNMRPASTSSIARELPML
jgi:hypothetical protein